MSSYRLIYRFTLPCLCESRKNSTVEERMLDDICKKITRSTVKYEEENLSIEKV